MVSTSTDANAALAPASNGENDDMDLEDEDDEVFNTLVASATGASTTPDPTNMPQAAVFDSPILVETKQ